MNVEEAAKRLEVSKSLMYRLVQEGRIPHLRIGQNGRRGCIRISEEDIKRFLETVKSGRA